VWPEAVETGENDHGGTKFIKGIAARVQPVGLGEESEEMPEHLRYLGGHRAARSPAPNRDRRQEIGYLGGAPPGGRGTGVGRSAPGLLRRRDPKGHVIGGQRNASSQCPAARRDDQVTMPPANRRHGVVQKKTIEGLVGGQGRSGQRDQV